MKHISRFTAIALLFALGCRKHGDPTSSTTDVSGPFNEAELARFSALSPIDTHTHFYGKAPAFATMLQKLNLHVVDILVAHTPEQKDLDVERDQALAFIQSSGGRAVLATTFNPFPYAQPKFSQNTFASLNQDFDKGAIAVKIWKNIGEQVKNAKGGYVLPDDPVWEPIYQDIAAHDKTLIAHVADPNTIWEAPDKNAADYSYYTEHPEWYMYGRANAPSKEAILQARDRMLAKNPQLRVVGAHLGSMEADFNQIADRLDKYPNFAIDLAARMPYIVAQPRADIIRFITKYQDRLIYATDDELAASENPADVATKLEASYALDWRYFATSDSLVYRHHAIQGLALPEPILRKLYHDNAVKWFPGVVATK